MTGDDKADWGRHGRRLVAELAAAHSDAAVPLHGAEQVRSALTWGDGAWRALVEYRVDDFEAELGFFVGALGFAVVLLEADYCQLAPPGERPLVALRRPSAGRPATPAGALSVQLAVADLDAVVMALAQRGLAMTDGPRTYDPAHPGWRTAAARTPAGQSLRLWGEPRRLGET